MKNFIFFSKIVGVFSWKPWMNIIMNFKQGRGIVLFAFYLGNFLLAVVQIFRSQGDKLG